MVESNGLFLGIRGLLFRASTEPGRAAFGEDTCALRLDVQRISEEVGFLVRCLPLSPHLHILVSPLEVSSTRLR